MWINSSVKTYRHRTPPSIQRHHLHPYQLIITVSHHTSSTPSSCLSRSILIQDVLADLFLAAIRPHVVPPPTLTMIYWKITNQSRTRSIKPWLKAHLNPTTGDGGLSIDVIHPRWQDEVPYSRALQRCAPSCSHIHVYFLRLRIPDAAFTSPVPLDGLCVIGHVYPFALGSSLNPACNVTFFECCIFASLEACLASVAI